MGQGDPKLSLAEQHAGEEHLMVSIGPLDTEKMVPCRNALQSKGLHVDSTLCNYAVSFLHPCTQAG